MRIGNVNQGRPAYYDRNPVGRVDSDLVDVVPHGSTVRWTYTVPTGTKAYIQRVRGSIFRTTVAAPVARVDLLIDVQPSVAEGRARIIDLESLANTVGARDAENFAGAGLLEAGGEVRLITADQSTGGTVLYAGTLWSVEFDV